MDNINSLSSRSVVLEIIKKYELRPKKYFGQNFLTDKRVIEKIVNAAGVTKNDIVLEVGPGLGALTSALAEKAGMVYAVEIDKDLIAPLSSNLDALGLINVEIINADILKLDINKAFQTNEKKIKIAANLPYYITTPIIFHFLENKFPVESMTVMVQKEVAERMRALPSTKDYGALTLAINYYAKPTLAANVPSNCFIPRPDVDSAVCHLEIYDSPPVNVTSPTLMFSLIRAAFSKRRKTLLNCLTAEDAFGIGNGLDGRLRLSKDDVKSVLKTIGLPEDVRGEALTLEDFANVSNELFGSGHLAFC